MSENKQLEIRKNAYSYKFANYLIGGLANLLIDKSIN